MTRYNSFGLLTCRRRRLAVNLLALHEQGDTVEVNNLSRIIRSIEKAEPAILLNSGEYESAYNSLIQNHLPRLSDSGVIEYDERQKTVMVTPEVVRLAGLSAMSHLFDSDKEETA